MIETAILKSPSASSNAATTSSPMRRMFVLAQTQPVFEILATSNDEGRLERERDTLLAKPWDQGADGVRELRIKTVKHLCERPRDRRRFQRQNRFR